MYTKERKNAEYVKYSVPIGEREAVHVDAQPDMENCSNGLAPQPNAAADGVRRMKVPVVQTMTKYLFDHYRLTMYAYLNKSLRRGQLGRIVDFGFTNRTINRNVCTFRSVNYWRIDRLNFWADVHVSLFLSTQSGIREWRGYLCFWFSAEDPGPLVGTIEEMTNEDEAPDRGGMTLLSPYLIPYFTSAKMDDEAENIWETYIHGALEDPELREARALAKAMGLSIKYVPLHEHKGVNSVLFLIDDFVTAAENKEPPEEVSIPANTIVINTNAIKKEYSDFNIYHECVHYYEHCLFFRLQEMHHNDLLRMKTEEIEITEDEEKANNPVYWMEKQANRCAYGLMLPANFMRRLMAEKRGTLNTYAHEGEKYEQIGLAIAEEYHIPHFRLRARMIQLGHIHAKGALNYVDRVRIQPYSFDEESLRRSEHTFNIDRVTAGCLYEKNLDFRKLLDSGKFIYADGHIVRNEPRFVDQAPWGHMLTPWASSRVDRCCLRFTRIYVQENAGEYVFGRMNYDADYVKQTMFYLEDLINEREMDDIEAELQYKRRFPETFIEAFDMLMKRNGDTRETMAEKLNTTSRSLYEWLKDPERRINVDFVVTVALLWRLPDWISALLLDRAYIHFSETNRRHLALQYILKVLWSEGVNKANEFLKERKLERLTV